jgi:hypothetical protein
MAQYDKETIKSWASTAAASGKTWSTNPNDENSWFAHTGYINEKDLEENFDKNNPVNQGDNQTDEDASNLYQDKNGWFPVQFPEWKNPSQGYTTADAQTAYAEIFRQYGFPD